MLCLKTTAQAINAANYLNLNWLPHLIPSHMTFETEWIPPCLSMQSNDFWQRQQCALH